MSGKGVQGSLTVHLPYHSGLLNAFPCQSFSTGSPHSTYPDILSPKVNSTWSAGLFPCPEFSSFHRNCSLLESIPVFTPPYATVNYTALLWLRSHNQHFHTSSKGRFLLLFPNSKSQSHHTLKKKQCGVLVSSQAQ